MSCRQLARAALFLAFDGRDPISGQQMVSSEFCRRINAVMMSCGHYDNSGDFTYRIGLPGKSGVGGGILVIAPRSRLGRRLVPRSQSRRYLPRRQPGPRSPREDHRLVGVCLTTVVQ